MSRQNEIGLMGSGSGMSRGLGFCGNEIGK